MSERQTARGQRKDAFWSEKYANARDSKARLVVAFDEVRAAVERLPADQRNGCRDQLATYLRHFAAGVTQSQLHSKPNSQPAGPVRPSTRPAATRARARRQV